ncbi:dihydrofolate reductase [Paenibacillus sp. LBL]|uniref:dihydrofolate reductase n=1 Tax=Paenibacillus sp. LBL TaxID=2940563 RepID=UPI002473A7E3|nr:dihydrofolate reductase [Paenibacillus sp. LBL]MDH6674300.1 dihydrofolate reductase [Paenibacillus sp. LBL]
MISLVAAMGNHNVIGNKNELPWHLPADLKYFRALTLNGVVVMGRKTYESIGKALPNRTNIIMTRDTQYWKKDAIVFHSVDDVILYKEKNDVKHLFVIGGSEVYNLFMPIADRLHITKINHDFKGDAYFPDINPEIWGHMYERVGIKDANNNYNYSFNVYYRK